MCTRFDWDQRTRRLERSESVFLRLETDGLLDIPGVKGWDIGMGIVWLGLPTDALWWMLVRGVLG